MLTLPLLSFLCQSLAGLHEIIKTVMDDHFSLFSRCFQRRSRVSMPPLHTHTHTGFTLLLLLLLLTRRPAPCAVCLSARL